MNGRSEFPRADQRLTYQSRGKIRHKIANRESQISTLGHSPLESTNEPELFPSASIEPVSLASGADPLIWIRHRDETPSIEHWSRPISSGRSSPSCSTCKLFENVLCLIRSIFPACPKGLGVSSRGRAACC